MRRLLESTVEEATVNRFQELGCPPDRQEAATELLMLQAESLAAYLAP